MVREAIHWNDDKPHRCPECHTVTVFGKPSSLAVYTCCQCLTRFTRWPVLAFALPHAKSHCSGHAEGEKTQ